jgi:hypothetical protein
MFHLPFRKQATRATRSCAAGSLLMTTVLLLATAAAMARAEDTAVQRTIPAGTVITYANWQQYERFMPAGMQALFLGDRFWKLPKDVAIEVGSTTSIPLPRKFLEDTEQYSALVKLAGVPAGGYVPVGYFAGIPFPNPEKDPALMPYELFYDGYYHYTPRLQRTVACNYSLDSYGNFTRTQTSDCIYSQLTHLSDIGFPPTVSNAGDYFLVKYLQQIAPEQGKYTTSLDISYADVTRLDVIYIYSPSNRRSLRLSEAARCAPLQGTDFTWEDSNEGPPSLPHEFKMTYVGGQRILTLVHAASEAFPDCGSATALPPKYFYAGGKAVVPWSTPALGKWEVRDAYVIEMDRLPAFAPGYCYGKRVLYIDRETYFPLATELYDHDGKLYKYLFELLAPMRVPKTGLALGVNGPDELFAINFADKHVTIKALL